MTHVHPRGVVRRRGKVLKLAAAAAASFAALMVLAPASTSSEIPAQSLEQHLRAVIPCQSLTVKSTFCNSRLTAAEQQSIDRQTGLVAPAHPGARQTVLPRSKATERYLKETQEFQALREKVRQAKEAFQGQRSSPAANMVEANDFLNSREDYFVSRVEAWNGQIFWAPAGRLTDPIIVRAGDEIRSVFGPIPPFDVTTLGERVTSDGWRITTALLPTEVDGNRVQLVPNTSLPGNPLQFEHTDVNGNHVKWATAVEKCDKPSLAGGVTPCGAASRISRAVKGTVEWLALARKADGVDVLQANSYWSPDDPAFALIGYIGFNRVSGEVAFFDGANSAPRSYNWNAAIVPPGGAGYGDAAGRKMAATTYDATFRIDCANCHENKEPRIITPYMKHERVGYSDPVLAVASSVGNLLPEMTRNVRQPYRVVGTGYNAQHAGTIARGRIFEDPTKQCASRCHGLTTLGTARFAFDSLGKLAEYVGADGQVDAAIENDYRTFWATRAGAGKIHPWMLPEAGNDLSTDPPAPEISDEAWKVLKDVMLGNSTAIPLLPIYTEAPAPESKLKEKTRLADPAGPASLVATVTPNRDNNGGTLEREIHLQWIYLNTLGGVPTRDDVRFNIAIAETDIPAGDDETPIEQYPTIEQAKGLTAQRVSDAVWRDGKIIILKDVSYAGHTRWTDAAPATTPRPYRVDFPVAKGKRYLIRLVAKRHTFDQSQFAFSEVDHVASVDVK